MLTARKTGLIATLLLVFIASGTATISINGTQLDMQGNPINNFFDTTGCGNNEAVTKIYSNGSYQCAQAGGGLPTVLGINNSANNSRITNLGGLDMTGDINLQGNNINGGSGSEIAASVFKVNSFLSLEGNDITNVRETSYQSGITVGGGATGTISMQSGYLEFEDAGGRLMQFGGGATPDAGPSGIHMEANTNPSAGDPLFVVESSGGSERLRVEHSGMTSTTNNFRADGYVESGGDVNVGSYVYTDDISDNGAGQVTFHSNIDTGLNQITADSYEGEAGELYLGDTTYVQGEMYMNGNQINEVYGLTGQNTAGELYIGTSNAYLESDGDVNLVADQDSSSGGNYFCWVEGSDGSWNCDGTKNWVHPYNSTHKMTYSSQESAQVRAVWDTTVNVTTKQRNVYRNKVELPEHFTRTISEKPDLKVQATPHDLATVAVTERTDTYVVVEATAPVKVDLTVKGIREGYKDRKIVTPYKNRTVTVNGSLKEISPPEKLRKIELPGMGKIPEKAFNMTGKNFDGKIPPGLRKKKTKGPKNVPVKLPNSTGMNLTSRGN